MKWNEYGVNREADTATYRELLDLRSAVRNQVERERTNERSQLVVALERVADILERIELKMEKVNEKT